MQTFNNVIKWSAFTSGVVGFLIISGIFASWFAVEVLVMLTAMNT
ncbi:MAG: hypothetical protein WBN96_06995 [Gammaproteobacteria bacterium]